MEKLGVVLKFCTVLYLLSFSWTLKYFIYRRMEYNTCLLLWLPCYLLIRWQTFRLKAGLCFTRSKTSILSDVAVREFLVSPAHCRTHKQQQHSENPDGMLWIFIWRWSWTGNQVVRVERLVVYYMTSCLTFYRLKTCCRNSLIFSPVLFGLPQVKTAQLVCSAQIGRIKIKFCSGLLKLGSQEIE